MAKSTQSNAYPPLMPGLKKRAAMPLVQIAVLGVVVLVAMLAPVGLLEDMENRHFDFWSTRLQAPDTDAIAIVAIDAKTIQQLGDWPLPRARVADMVRLMSSQRAQAQGFCLIYTKPEENPGLTEIKDLRSAISEKGWRGGKKTTLKFHRMLRASQMRLESEAKLVTAIRRARNVVLPFRLTRLDTPGVEGDRPSGLMIVNSIRAPEPTASAAGGEAAAEADNRGAPAMMVQETYADLARKAGAMGHLNVTLDRDGVVRRLPLLIEYKKRLYPSLALQLALRTTGANFKDLSIGTDFLGRPQLRIQHLEWLTDDAYRALVHFRPQWTRERTYSFADLLDGTVAPNVLKNKVVLLGVTDPSATPLYRVGPYTNVSLVEITANLVAQSLSKRQLSRPSWAQPLEVIAVLYFAVFLIILMPRVSPRLGAAILGIFLITWYALGVGLLLGNGFWIKLIGPMVLACVGFVLVQFSIISRLRRTEQVDNCKTLGLTYQGQGMLDMAYEKYIQCPVEDQSVRNLLYNLGLDFERKRMFNKAAAIYRHIQTGGAFKDITERIAKLRIKEDPLSATAGSGEYDATIGVDDTEVKPTFGRYQILSELGRGAMGTVYLGRDPKINRDVAIKTIAYDTVDDGELAQIKERFFREAEAAGKLSHANIMAIYDVGEEHDMAYIAMELLKGHDLTRYCQPDSLLPMPQVVSIISEVTAALDYAHQQGVVHRDIKPGNIMMLKDNRIKVTDFGIARVMDASQTSTGVVLGTPSYMSPEQMAGKEVDGRSDLFALGIVWYLMLTGEKPFKGDTISAVLYAISNHDPEPLSKHRSDVPICLKNIISKLLVKDVAKRFQSAAELDEAIAKCEKKLLATP